jgi:hypothetical protein
MTLRQIIFLVAAFVLGAAIGTPITLIAMIAARRRRGVGA